jgi:hypothetical protein
MLNYRSGDLSTGAWVRVFVKVDRGAGTRSIADTYSLQQPEAFVEWLMPLALKFTLL